MRDRILVLAVFLVGCGGDADPGEAFAGTWQWQAGSQAVGGCSDGSGYSEQMTGSVTLRIGTEADLIRVNGGCDIKFDVDGDTATAWFGQACVSSGTTSTGGAYTMRAMFKSDRLTLAGNTITEAASIELALSGALVGTCNLALNGTLRKIAE